AGAFWNALRGALRMSSMPQLTRSGQSSVEVIERAQTALAPARDPSVASSMAVVPGAHALPERAKPSSSTRLIALGAIALVVAGGAFAVSMMVRRGDQHPPLAASASTSASAGPIVPSASAPSSSAAHAAKGCPPGMIRIPGGQYFMGSDARDA